MRSEFSASVLLSVHSDGKLTEDMTFQEQVDWVLVQNLTHQSGPWGHCHTKAVILYSMGRRTESHIVRQWLKIQKSVLLNQYHIIMIALATGYKTFSYTGLLPGSLPLELLVIHLMPKTHFQLNLRCTFLQLLDSKVFESCLKGAI